MKKVLLIIILLFPVLIQAETSDLETLKVELSKAVADQEKAKILKKLSVHCIALNLKEGIGYGKSLLELGKKANNPKWQIEGLVVTIKGYVRFRNLDEGKVCFDQLKKIVEDYNYNQYLYRVHWLQGNLNILSSSFEKALNNFIAALEYLTESDEPENVQEKYRVQLYANMGGIYTVMGQGEKALEYFKLAKEMNLKSENYFDAIRDISNIARYYYKLEKYKQAKKTCVEGLELITKHNLKISTDVFTLIHAISNIRIYKDNFQKDILEKARDDIYRILPGLKRTSSKNAALLSLGKAEFALGNHSKAIENLNKLLKRKPNISSGMVMSVEETFSNIYEQKGNFKQALAHLKTLRKLERKFLDNNTAKNISDMQIKYDTLKKSQDLKNQKQENELLQEKAKRQKLTTFGFGLGLILTTLLAFLIYMAYRIKIKALTREKEISRKDPLTQLMNRRAMNEEIEKEIIRFERSKVSFSLVITDIDHFKKFNDMHGHKCGDEVLKMVSDIFRNTVRKQDRIARWGGEEFLLLLPDTGEEGAAKLAEKLRSAMETSILEYHSEKLNITMSFGVCKFSSEINADTCINSADEALYKAKDTGRNCVEIY